MKAWVEAFERMNQITGKQFSEISKELSGSTDMEQRLTTLEMLAEIKPGDKYITKTGNTVVMDELGILIWDDIKEKVTITLSLIKREEWEKVDDSVDFMTAVNSGKRIKHEYWDEYHELDEAISILWRKVSVFRTEGNDRALKLINGKWYIED